MRYIFLWLLVFISFSAKTEGVIVLDNYSSSEKYELVGNLFYYIDSSELLTFETALSEEFKSKLTQAPSNKFSYSANAPVQWYYVDIENNSDQFKFLVFSINNPFVENITFYNSLDSSYQYVGSKLSFDQRKFKNKNFVFPLSIPPRSKVKLCTRIASQNRSLHVPFSLTDGSYYLSSLRLAYLYNGILYTIWGLMVLILIILWRSEKDRTYLFYAISSTFVGLLKLVRDGFFAQYIFTSVPEFNAIFEQILYAALLIAALLTANERYLFSKSKGRSKLIYNITISFSALLLISQFISRNFMVLKIGALIITALLITLISINYNSIKKRKSKNVKLIISVAAVVTTILILNFAFGFDIKGIGLFDWSIWSLAIILFFFSAINILVYKFYLAREEVFILNRDLEIKVQERTAQINAQKEELKLQHKEMLQQKEVLQSQREELRARKELLQLKNSELEKLSLVASKTNNLIYIFDPDGDLDWFNASYGKLINTTHREYQENGNTVNIMEISTNKNIKHIVNSCLREKTVVSYESIREDSDGQKLWYHTTLTPILDDRNNIKHLIAIDTDITQLKEYESAIDSQRKDAENQKNLALKRKEELEVRQMEITDSIRYAKRIQTAIMPSVKQIFRDFPDNFVLFLPKDIVSGDFYWYHRIKDKYFIAAVDCTGHGVPGAFMSIIGNYLLNSIIIHNGVEKPSDILKQLNRKIKISLKSDTREQTSDGMDIAIAVIDKKDNTLQFASALRPLFIFNKGSFMEIKGDKAPITSNITGSMLSNYTNHEVQLNEGDSFYMFSDGIIDQFGGNKGKKFLTKRFKQLLFEINPLSMREQKDIIKKAFDDWKGTYEQVDDVLVMGVRYSQGDGKRKL